MASFLFAAYTPLKVALGWHSAALAPTLSTVLPSRPAMAPHLTLAEQDVIFAAHASGKTAAKIFELIAKRREKAGTPMVNITVLRRFLRGRTHRRGRVETRGRQQLTGSALRTLRAPAR